MFCFKGRMLSWQILFSSEYETLLNFKVFDSYHFLFIGIYTILLLSFKVILKLNRIFGVHRCMRVKSGGAGNQCFLEGVHYFWFDCIFYFYLQVFLEIRIAGDMSLPLTPLPLKKKKLFYNITQSLRSRC